MIVAVVISAVGSLGHLVEKVGQDVGLGIDGASVSTITTAQRAEKESAVAAALDYPSSWALNALSFLAVAVTAVWLIVRNKSPAGSPAPRPLATDVSVAACDNAVDQRQKIVQRLYNDTDAFLKGDVEVRHLMSDRPVTVGPNATTQRACEIMEEHRLDYLLVCDANGELLGLVSHYHLVRRSEKKVADAMLPNPLFVGPDAMLSPTVSQMLNEGVSCVAVIERDRAIGMVTTRDIQLTLQAAMQVLARATSERRFVEPEPTATV